MRGGRRIVCDLTMDWAGFDLNSQVATIPRRYAFTGVTPGGDNGKNGEPKRPITIGT